MTQVSTETDFKFSEGTLPKKSYEVPDNTDILTTSDMLFLGGEPDIQVYTPRDAYEKEAGFIGPIDATNVNRGLLENQARDLGKIAAVNFPMYESFRAKVLSSTKEHMADGTLRLGSEFRDMSADQQAEKFVASTVTAAYVPAEGVAAELKAEREKIRLGKTGPEKEAQEDLIEARKQILLQSRRILTMRNILVEKDASDEFLREFDYTMRIMTKPEQVAYEHERELASDDEVVPLVNTEEMTIYNRFRGILALTFSKEAVRRVVLIAPQSAPVTVISQDEKTV